MVEEIGIGLLNQDLIRRVTERWHQGGIGVLYLYLQIGNEDAVGLLREWVLSQPHVFWFSEMNGEYFFFLDRKNERDRMETLLADMAEELKSLLPLWNLKRKDKDSNLLLGMARVCPTADGRSAEAMIHLALKEAAKSAREKSPQTEGLAPAPRDTGITESAGRYSANRIGDLAALIPKFHRHTRVSEIARLFENNPKIQGAVIVDGDRPIGLIMKEKLHQLLAGQYGLPLYWNRPVEKIMDEELLVVEENYPVEEVSQMAMARDFNKLYDVVTITQNGKLKGAASIRTLLESITMLRTEAARTANPLTGLPGNEGIQQEMQRRIERKEPFSVIYADLDFFKWFNDCFGFRKGDELIRYTADVLQKVVLQFGSKPDFIGHIGGDDFIVITDAENPDIVCRHIIWCFDGGVKSFYGGTEVTHVADRTGKSLERAGVTISLSLMTWDGSAPVTPETISELTARLKKQAKKQQGSVYVMEKICELQHGEGRR